MSGRPAVPPVSTATTVSGSDDSQVPSEVSMYPSAQTQTPPCSTAFGGHALWAMVSVGASDIDAAAARAKILMTASVLLFDSAGHRSMPPAVSAESQVLLGARTPATIRKSAGPGKGSIRRVFRRRAVTHEAAGRAATYPSQCRCAAPPRPSQAGLPTP